MNLPIRQCYVVATDNGRAEWRLRTAPIMFLGANTVVEFYVISCATAPIYALWCSGRAIHVLRKILRRATISRLLAVTSLVQGTATFRLIQFLRRATRSFEKRATRMSCVAEILLLPRQMAILVGNAVDSSRTIYRTAADTASSNRWFPGRLTACDRSRTIPRNYVTRPLFGGFGDR